MIPDRLADGPSYSLLAPFTDRVATRRGAWIALVLWIAATLVFSIGAANLPAPTVAPNDLPPTVESRRAATLVERSFPGQRGTPALVVYARPKGLTAADRAQAHAFTDWLHSPAAPRLIGAVSSPFDAGLAARGLISRDGSTLLVAVSIMGDAGDTAFTAVVDSLRKRAGTGTDGLQIRVTGPAGIVVDAAEIFKSADLRLLLATVALVLVLLGVVYRAPLLAVIPLLAVGCAYGSAHALLTIGAHVAGKALSGQVTSTVTVLLFGAGTDYTLFIISRYRAALTQHSEPAVAMRLALRSVAEPVLASGGVVVLATLALTLASFGTYHDTGVAAATSVAVVLLAGLTLIPALLVLFGRAAFWPVVPRVGDPLPAPGRLWEFIGRFVSRRPVIASILSLLLLGGLATGIGSYQERFDFLQSFLKPTPSADGFLLLRVGFGAGALAPTQVFVTPAGGAATTRGAVQGVSRALQAISGVEGVIPGGNSLDGRTALLQVTFADNPYAPGTIARIENLRVQARAALNAEGGGSVLVGGETATSYDAKVLSDRDTRLVVVVVLLVIALVLGLLLRSIIAPIYLILINALGYGAALGLLLLINRTILGSPTASFEMPLNVFVFLTALGADYNIFLLSRVREEAQHYPLSEAMGRSVTATGGVITSAGIILAGTFSVLAVLPIRETVEVGVGVALGVLLDTFIVRALLVPGVTLLIGRYAWWPARIGLGE